MSTGPSSWGDPLPVPNTSRAAGHCSSLLSSTFSLISSISRCLACSFLSSTTSFSHLHPLAVRTCNSISPSILCANHLGLCASIIPIALLDFLCLFLALSSPAHEQPCPR